MRSKEKKPIKGLISSSLNWAYMYSWKTDLSSEVYVHSVGTKTTDSSVNGIDRSQFSV